MNLSNYLYRHREEVYGQIFKIFCHDPNYEFEVYYSFDVLMGEVGRGYFDEYEIREVAYNFPLNICIFELLHLDLEEVEI